MDAKFDGGKPRMELIPAEWIIELANVLTVGAERYGENSWRRLPNALKRYEGAALRHLMHYKQMREMTPDGAEVISDDGLPSLAQAAVNLLFMFSIERRKEDAKPPTPAPVETKLPPAPPRKKGRKSKKS